MLFVFDIRHLADRSHGGSWGLFHEGMLCMFFLGLGFLSLKVYFP
jgi:hypothetical protein